jgi:8-oxo-dGTP pyrophosphatase MutT (NUDIX family)
MITAAGVLIFSRRTGRCLLLQKRSGKNQGSWGLCGGSAIEGESFIQNLLREVGEEIGENHPSFIKVFPIEKFVSHGNQFRFQTYLGIVDEEFVPELSDEHIAWGWFDLSSYPRPLHRGLHSSLKNQTFQIKIQTIMDIADWL